MNDRKGLISTYAHGIIDYVVGVALLFAPNIFGFASLGGAPDIIPRFMGIAIIAMALLTQYELGLFKLIPFKAHKTIDIIAGLYLALSPFIHGFASEPANAWVPHLIVGVAIIAVAFMSQTKPASRSLLRRAYS